MKVSSKCANSTVRMDKVSSGDNVYPTMDYNIDLKAILGLMFYKYDKFRIEFNSFDGWSNFPTWTSVPNTGI
jgi:hypothetical protein